MVNFERFREAELPYDKFEKFGLTQEMIDDLPQIVMRRLMASRETPLLPIITTNMEGKKIKSEARISLVRLENGSVDIALSPKWESHDLTAFSETQQKALLNGKVIISDVQGKGECYVQYDDTIQQAMSVPVAVIRQNIGIIEKDFTVNSKQSDDFNKGKVIQIVDERGNMTSVGIDLQAITGIRTVDGDTLAWQNEAKAEQLPEYSFGIYGCWKTDDYGSMTYVPEKEFTPEMEAEMHRLGQQNAAGQNMRQLHV